MEETLKEKLTSLRELINSYEYSNNAEHLYPLSRYVKYLRTLCNQQTDNVKFNNYIANTILPNIDDDINICNQKKQNPEDGEYVKKRTLEVLINFIRSCDFYSVNVLSKQIKETLNLD